MTGTLYEDKGQPALPDPITDPSQVPRRQGEMNHCCGATVFQLQKELELN